MACEKFPTKLPSKFIEDFTIPIVSIKDVYVHTVDENIVKM